MEVNSIVMNIATRPGKRGNSRNLRGMVTCGLRVLFFADLLALFVPAAAAKGTRRGGTLLLEKVQISGGFVNAEMANLFLVNFAAFVSRCLIYSRAICKFLQMFRLKQI